MSDGRRTLIYCVEKVSLQAYKQATHHFARMEIASQKKTSFIAWMHNSKTMRKKAKTSHLLFGLLLFLFTVQVGECFYNPSTGRWLSRDSIGEPQQEVQRNRALGMSPDDGNIYTFVYNDGINKIDPKGETVWWDCVACAAALVGKFGGTFAGCAYGCAQSTSPSYTYGQCLSDCLTSMMKPCELWKSFKGNPGEWVGAAACISCGVRAIKNMPPTKPPGCEDCPVPKWKPRICSYACGSGTSGKSFTRVERYPGEYDRGCPPMQWFDPATGTYSSCVAFGPVGAGWPQAPPPTTEPNPPRR